MQTADGYQIQIVSDDDLPDECDWAFALLGTGLIVLFLKRRAMGRACVLAEAWGAFRAISQRRRVA